MEISKIRLIPQNKNGATPQIYMILQLVEIRFLYGGTLYDRYFMVFTI